MNEIAIKDDLSPGNWLVMKEQASMLIKTRFLPSSITTPEQVLAIALTGKELGIGMMEALRGINVIQGKSSVSPQLMLALARRTGEMEQFAIHAPGRLGLPPDHTGAECTVKRKGNAPHVTVFGPTEAKALGLEGKDNYKKQPGTMYQWRAIAANLRVTFPDAISGLYTPDELGAEVVVNESGDMSIKPMASPISYIPPQEKKQESQEALPNIEFPKQSITKTEQMNLFKLAKAAYGRNFENGLKGYLKSQFNVERTEDLEPSQYLDACSWLKELANELATEISG